MGEYVAADLGTRTGVVGCDWEAIVYSYRQSSTLVSSARLLQSSAVCEFAASEKGIARASEFTVLRNVNDLLCNRVKPSDLDD